MAQPHLAYPDLAVDIFSGTDPDQDAGAFIHLIECKTKFVLGTEPHATDAEHAIYRFRKKPYSPRYYEDQKLNVMAALLKVQWPAKKFELYS